MVYRSYPIVLVVTAACHMPTESFHGPGTTDAGDITGACPHVEFSLAATPILEGTMVSSVAVGDVDNDSSPDVVVTSAPDGVPGKVTVLIGDGRGGFSAGTDYLAGSAPQSVVLADIDGKGFLDLVVVNSGETAVGVFLNHGGMTGAAGTFGPMALYQSKGNPSSVAVGNFDQNPGLDLAVTDKNVSGWVSILPNAGSGTFPAHNDVQTEPDGTPWSVAVTNLNGGAPDLVIANHALSSVNVLLGDGKGGFQTLPPVSVGRQPSSVAVGTLHSGGKPYVFVTNSVDGTVSVLQYLNNNLVSASTPLALPGTNPRCIVVKDLNHDDKLDLVIADGDSSGTVSVLLGNGDGTFQAPTFSMTGGVNPRSVAVEDMNGDGLPDLVVANESGAVNVLTSRCMP